MLGIHNLPLFIISGILLNLTPGQDTLYIVGRSVAQGRRAGLLSVAGIVSGLVVHTCAAAFGLSAILAASTTAFLAVKIAGAAYLVYLGVRMAFGGVTAEEGPAPFARESDWAVYRAGVLTNVLNPKVAIFFMAFLPQFVTPGSDARVLAFLVLGAIFIFNGTLWCLVLVTAASAMSRRLQANRAAGSWLRRLTGLTFVGLGVKLAATE